MRPLLALLLCLAAGPAAAEAVAPPDDLAFCSTCHGVQLMGNETLGAPRLSGLPDWYVERQLRAYQAGWRGADPGDEAGYTMRAMAQSLTEQQVLAAARYAAQTRSPLPATSGSGDAARGEALYAVCQECHGNDGAGNPQLQSPPLTGLDDGYLVKQLEDYRSGVRGSHPQDTAGQQMQAIAATLPDREAIADLVAHLAALRAQTAHALPDSAARPAD